MKPAEKNALLNIIAILDFYDKNPNIIFDKEHELSQEEVKDLAYVLLKGTRRFEFLTEDEYREYSFKEIKKALEESEAEPVNETVPEMEALENFEQYEERFKAATGDEQAKIHLSVNQWIEKQTERVRQQDQVIIRALDDTFNIPKEKAAEVVRNIRTNPNKAVETLTNATTQQAKPVIIKWIKSAANSPVGQLPDTTPIKQVVEAQNDELSQINKDPAGHERWQIQELKKKYFGNANAVISPQQERIIQQTVRAATQKIIAGDTNRPVQINHEQLKQDLKIDQQAETTKIPKIIQIVSEDKQRETNLSADDVKVLRQNIDNAEKDPTNYEKQLEKVGYENLAQDPGIKQAELTNEDIERRAKEGALHKTQQLLELGRQLPQDTYQREVKLSQIVPAAAPDLMLEVVNKSTSPALATLPIQTREKIAENARKAQTMLTARVDAERIMFEKVLGRQIVEVLDGPRQERFTYQTQEEERKEGGIKFNIDLDQLDRIGNIYDKFFGTHVEVIPETAPIEAGFTWYNPNAVTIFKSGEAVVSAGATAGGAYIGFEASSALVGSFATNGLMVPGLPLLGSGGAASMSNEALFSLIQASLGHEGPLTVIDAAGNIIGRSLIGEAAPAVIVWNGIVPTAATGATTALATAGAEAVAIGTAETAAGAAAAAGTTAITTAGAEIAAGATAATTTAAGILGFLATPLGAALLAVSTWLTLKFGKHIVKIFAALGALVGFIPFGAVGALAGGAIGAGLAGGITGGSLAAAGATITGGFAALGGAFAAAIAVPFISALIGIPVVVALILFIINSGAYVVPAGIGISGGGGSNVTCDSSASKNSAAQAAICIVSYLNQFNLNPLTVDLLNTPSWQSLVNVLPKPASDALAQSAPIDGHLQCVGFVAATAGMAYGSSFGQIDACSYIANPPSGYNYTSGTSGIQSGDFFVINGFGGCSQSSPGHIGVVTSVDGALISCADANYDLNGKARSEKGCFALSQITGYLRKQ